MAGSVHAAGVSTHSLANKHTRWFFSDLKPDNILLDERGHVHLTDFNIAVHYTERKHLTGVAGSLAYMGTSQFQYVIGDDEGFDLITPSQPQKFYTRRVIAT